MGTVPNPLDSPTCATTAAARPLPNPMPTTTTTTTSTTSPAHNDDTGEAAAAGGDAVVHRSTTPRRQSTPTIRSLVGRQLLLRLMPQLHDDDVTDARNYWLPYCVIFGSGVGCALLLMILLNTFLAGGHTAPIMHTLPAGHFLQVRDEFQMIAPHAADSPAAPSTNNVQSRGTEENQLEALTTLRVALDMRAAGKADKALRLFRHALALAPRNADVLTNYGEYLEHCQRDVLHADLLYTQALSANPAHEIARANRRRTASIVDALDRTRLAELDAKRDAISAIPASNAALRRAKKEAYFQNVYHSVGIEGNTMTLAQTRSVLETRMAVHGKSIDEHNEILGLDAAMKYINATLVNQNGYITMQDILEVHRRVLGHVDPIEGGELRRTQVYVGGHVPPGPGDLGVLMLRFEQWLNSAQTAAMHPVRLAALAHYKLVHIHPFVDGNGRTSRLLMNTILMRSGYPPVIIPKQQRHKYYDFLQMANEGDTRPFVRFVADCTEKTLDLFLWATSELAHQVPLLAQNEWVGGDATASVLSSVLDGEDEDSGDGATSTLRSAEGDPLFGMEARQNWQWEEEGQSG